MQLGMIGLGRMGANMVRRLLRDGHECVVYDHSPDAVQALVRDGAGGRNSLQEFVAQQAPHHVGTHTTETDHSKLHVNFLPRLSILEYSWCGRTDMPYSIQLA